MKIIKKIRDEIRILSKYTSKKDKILYLWAALLIFIGAYIVILRCLWDM